MIYIQKFNERYQPNIKDTLNSLKKYFTTEGSYTENLLDHSIFLTNKLVIELDIASAYKGGKSERDRIKQSLNRVGFEPVGNSQYMVTLSPDDLEWVKDFFSSL